MELSYDIRLIRAPETAVLRKMLFQAIFVPEGAPVPDAAITGLPELRRFYEHWGRPGDLALVALLHAHGAPGPGTGHPQIIGAAWYRLFPAAAPGYGFVAEHIPELTVAVVAEYRGRGVGRALLQALLSRAQAAGHPGLSLSVDRRNPALRLYERLGFKAVKEGSSRTMLLEFSRSVDPRDP